MLDWLPYIPHPQWLLLALMVGLYLHEIAALLSPTELLLIYSRRGWEYSCGNPFFQLRGRNLYLPRLNQLFLPAFRLSWQPCGCSTPIADWPSATQRRHWQRLRWPARLLTIWVLLTCLATLSGHINLIALGLLLFYIQLLMTLFILWRMRTALDLTPARLGALAIEWFCCPVLAPNLIRRLSLSQQPTIDGLGLAARRLPHAAWQALAAQAREVQQTLLDFDLLPAEQHRATQRLSRFLQSEQS